MNIVDMPGWINILGWTLLHSLWQGFIIGMLSLWLRQILPSASSSLKYAISTGALLLILIGAVTTFICFVPETVTPAATKNAGSTMQWVVFPSGTLSLDPSAVLLVITRWINDHLSVLVSGWLAGILFFGFRMLVVWSRTVRLRISASPIAGFWENKLRELALDLRISQTILLAESKLVDAPVLLGYLKPIIMLPVGMMSGLSFDQIETILLHELAHIRRHDFAINFIQSAIEVIFFFNPFVWILSSQIRSDREQCCDDIVVNRKNPLAYAQALHQLAEAMTCGTSFSLGVAGSRNKLLQRIKRIMKTSEKKEESRGKVIPTVLVMMALAIASWLSVQASLPERTKQSPVKLATGRSLTADTVKKDLLKEKPGSIHRQTVTTLDEYGERHTEITEKSEGDEDIDPWVILDEPVFAEIPAEMPALDVPVEMEVPAMTKMNFELANLDTFPQPDAWQFAPDREQWKKEFTEKFRNRFSDFYEKNRPEFDKMMKELDENLKKIHENIDQNMASTFDRKFQWELGRMDMELQRLAPRQEEMMRAREESMKKMSEDMGRQGERLTFRMKEQEGHMRSMERKMKSFEKELSEELIRDGYLGKDDKINSINWEKDGSIKINGKNIKETDQKKYKDLHNKYFKEGAHFGLAE